MPSLVKNAGFDVISGAVAAGTSTVTPTASSPTEGFEVVTFLIKWGAIVANGVQSVEVHGSDDDTTFSALEGTNITVADTDDDKITIVEVVTPQHAYLKPVINRATQNSTIESIVAIRSGARATPVTQTSDVSGVELHVGPIAGTA